MIMLRHVTYTYPEAGRPALQDVSLDLPEGSFAVVVGLSGAGKSTLLRCLNGLVPHFSGGTLSGSIRVHGLDPVQVAPQGMSHTVGFVFQDPETQFVVDQVEDEIAFALENSAMPRQDMRVRVEEVLDLLDLAPLRERRLETLSGGERQRVAIAAALALRPRVLVLDEPTSQLDPKSAEDVLHALERLNSDLGLTIVLAEHRLERVLSFADVLVCLPERGEGVLAGLPEHVLHQIDLTPPLVTLGKALGWNPLPLTIKAGKRFARQMIRSASPQETDETDRAKISSHERPFLQLRGVEVHYRGTPALRGIDLDVWSGEVVVLMGRNGAGKTTLLKTLVGLERAKRGTVRIAGETISGRGVAEVCRQVGYLPQDPNALLFAETVEEEIATTLRNHGITVSPGDLDALLERLDLRDRVACYPRDLSVGERQRVALAAIAVMRPGALLLDEPTRGLDYRAKRELARLLREWREGGMAVLLVTHDVELAALLADRVVLMGNGDMIARGTAAEVMGASPLFAPQVARLFPGSGWLTAEEALDDLHR